VLWLFADFLSPGTRAPEAVGFDSLKLPPLVIGAIE